MGIFTKVSHLVSVSVSQRHNIIIKLNIVTCAIHYQFQSRPQVSSFSVEMVFLNLVRLKCFTSQLATFDELCLFAGRSIAIATHTLIAIQKYSNI